MNLLARFSTFLIPRVLVRLRLPPSQTPLRDIIKYFDWLCVQVCSSVSVRCWMPVLVAHIKATNWPTGGLLDKHRAKKIPLPSQSGDAISQLQSHSLGSGILAPAPHYPPSSAQNAAEAEGRFDAPGQSQETTNISKGIISSTFIACRGITRA
jgi:hypothetical protein